MTVRTVTASGTITDGGDGVTSDTAMHVIVAGSYDAIGATRMDRRACVTWNRDDGYVCIRQNATNYGSRCFMKG
jgi:hypothetical protein